MTRPSVHPMGDGRELRWSLEPRSFSPGSWAPPVLLVPLWIGLSVQHGVVLLPVFAHGAGPRARSDPKAGGCPAGNFAQEHSGELPQTLGELALPDGLGPTYTEFLPLDPWRQPCLYAPRREGACGSRPWAWTASRAARTTRWSSSSTVPPGRCAR